MRRVPVVRRIEARESPAGEFSHARFRAKLARSAVVAGRVVIERALWLYYAAERPDVPRWAKLTIYGALAYFILPLDAVPDFIPGAGYIDDLGALSAALLTVASHVDENVKRRAALRLRQWFGNAPEQGGN